MKNSIIIALGAGLLLLVGCGKNVRVDGKVTFEDGSPLSTGTVIFTSGASQFTAPIESDGSYRAGTTNPGDGLPSGTYQVHITGAAKPGQLSARGAMLAPPELLIDSKFTRPETSGLTVEVKGRMTYDIPVTPPGR